MQYNFDEIVERSGTASLKYDLRGKVFRKNNVIPMWVADMDFKTPPFIIDALHKRLEHEILGYSCIMPSFAETASGWLLSRHNWQVHPNQINFTPGVVPALTMIVLAFTNPGDKVIIQPPVYFPFFSIVKNNGRVIIPNPLRYDSGRYSVDFDDLETKASQGAKMMILCSPHNPTGNVWGRPDLERISEICLRHNVLLVSDEIHADLVYSGYKHIPVASLYEGLADSVITCMSPSKTFNIAGLSTAYVVIKNPVMRKKYANVADRYHLAQDNLFGVVAMEAAYHQGHEWLDQLMDYLGANVDFLMGYFSKHMPQVHVVKPEATFMCWLDFKRTGIAHDDMSRLIIDDAGVGLSDGLVFGEEGRDFQRINIGCPRSLLKQALSNLHTTINNIMA